MAKMTTQQKLDQALAMVKKYTAELGAASIRENIEAGDIVQFEHGRAKTRKTLEGKVLGVKRDTNGVWVAVAVGEGFDLERYTIRTASITSNADADARIANLVA